MMINNQIRKSNQKRFLDKAYAPHTKIYNNFQAIYMFYTNEFLPCHDFLTKLSKISKNY